MKLTGSSFPYLPDRAISPADWQTAPRTTYRLQELFQGGSLLPNIPRLAQTTTGSAEGMYRTHATCTRIVLQKSEMRQNSVSVNVLVIAGACFSRLLSVRK